MFKNKGRHMNFEIQIFLNSWGHCSQHLILGRRERQWFDILLKCCRELCIRSVHVLSWSGITCEGIYNLIKILIFLNLVSTFRSQNLLYTTPFSLSKNKLTLGSVLSARAFSEEAVFKPTSALKRRVSALFVWVKLIGTQIPAITWSSLKEMKSVDFYR